MSEYFRPLAQIFARDLFDGRLGEHVINIHEHITEDTSERDRCLTDGQNYVCVQIDEWGVVYGFARYRTSQPGYILDEVAASFETPIVSEYDPQFWGFDTEAERTAFEDGISGLDDC